jgi:MFS family permease
VSERPAGRFDLLRTAPDFRLLFLATVESGIGTWLAVIALSVDVFDRTGSGKWVSALLIASFLPSVGVGLLLGPLVDRLSRRRLMIGADLIRAGVFALLPFVDRPGSIVALAAVTGFATGFFTPAVYAGLPNLVDVEALPQANSLLRSVDYLASTVGPLVGGALVAASGPHLAYWLNAVTFVISAALIVRIPERRFQVERAHSRGHWGDLRDGFSLVLHSRPLLTVLVAWSIATVGNAGINVAEIVIAKETFNSGDFGFGLLFAGFGFGLAFGSLYASTLLERWRIGRVYWMAILLMAFGVGAAALSPNVWVAAACVAVCGLGNGTAVVCNSLLVQRGAPDTLRGRAFTVIMSTNFALLGLGMMVAGPLTDSVGPRWVWFASAVLIGFAAVVAYALAHDIGGRSRTAEPPPPLAAETVATQIEPS